MKKTLLLTLFMSSLLLQIKAQLPNYVPSNQLLAYYSFDNFTSDISGNNNNGANNNVTFVNDRNGVPNAAAYFNGSNAWVEVTTPSFSMAYSDSFSYSFWINKETQPFAGIVMMIGSSVAGNFISIIQGPNEQQFGTNMQQSAWIWVSCPHTLNVWDHYVATYNAGTMNLYKNGVYQASGNNPYTSAMSANLPLFIGKGINTGYFAGAIDDIGIWSRVLTQQEINNLYASTITSLLQQSNLPQLVANPNIARDYIYLSGPTLNVKTYYNIYDLQGKILQHGYFTNVSQEISVTNLPAGFYNLQILDNKATTIKFIKE